MGQHAMNPPSVEGWHWGTQWLDSGTVVERVNLSSTKLGNVNNLGIRRIIDNIKSNISNQFTPEFLIEIVLEELGAIIVSKTTKETLNDFVKSKIDSEKALTDDNLSEFLQLVGAMPEYQRT